MKRAKKWNNIAYAEYNRTKGMSAFFFIQPVSVRTRTVNQYVIEHKFEDGSKLQVSSCKCKVNLNYMKCFNTRGEGQAIRVLFGSR